MHNEAVFARKQWQIQWHAPLFSEVFCHGTGRNSHRFADGIIGHSIPFKPTDLLDLRQALAWRAELDTGSSMLVHHNSVPKNGETA
jgi:hypothetical protein